MAEGLGDFIEAAGLLEYDPKAITEIYKGHPLRLLRRLWQTLIPLGLYLIGVGIDKITGILNNETRARSRAKEFTALLVELGPAFIKAGQALSTRPDIIPSIVLEELSQLQDQLPGFDCKLAMACIEEDLGLSIKDIYKDLDIKPISAASLGQVHKGTLKNGQKVAVKVQRPGLREQITLDLYIVRNIASWLKKNIKLIRSDLVALIDELGTRVFEEMDYLNEANNARKFQRLHKNNSRIAVPIIYEQATSRRVLTMEWIDGVKLTNLQAVRELGIDPDEMVEIGVNCSLQQLLEHGFFHADPHPGNLLALSDGRLCYLDFGMMSEISRESRTGLIQAVVHLVNKDFSELSKDFVELGFLAKDINIEPIIPAFENVFTSAIEIGVNKLDFKAVTDDLSNVMYKFPFQVPPYFALIIRSLITLEGIALSVDPEFKILGAAYPYFAKRLMEDPDPELRKSLKEMIFDGKVFSWNKIEDLVKSAASQADLNTEVLIDQVLDFLFSKNGGVLRTEIVEVTVSKMEALIWISLQQINNKLPKILKSKRISLLSQTTSIKNVSVLYIEPIKKFLDVVRNVPGFKLEIFIKRLPRFISEPEGRRMGLKVFQRVGENNIIRLIKIATRESK